MQYFHDLKPVPVLEPAYQYSNDTLPTFQPDIWTDAMLTLLCDLKLYVIPSVIAVGVAANALACYILGYTNLGTKSLPVYLRTICFVDSVFLLTLLLSWLQIFNINIAAIGGWCHGMTALSNCTTYMTLWMHVLIAVDRLLTLSPKSKFHFLTQNSSYAKVICLIVAVLGITVYVNMSLQSGLVSTEMGQLCIRLPDDLTAMYILINADLVINLVIPYSFMLTAIVIILVKLILYKRNRNTAISMQMHNSLGIVPLHIPRKNVRTTWTVLLMLSMFLLVTLPSHVTVMIVMFTQPSSFAASTTLYAYQQLTFFLFLCRFSLTFWLLISSSEAFRCSVYTTLSLPYKRITVAMKNHQNSNSNNRTTITMNALLPAVIFRPTIPESACV